MSINRKGSRRITVSGETYLWRIRDNWDHIKVVIQHEDEKHQFLNSTTESGVMLNGKTPPITPKIIEDLIKQALDRGWDPFAKTGKPIYIKMNLPEDWTFEGFWKINSN